MTTYTDVLGLLVAAALGLVAYGLNVYDRKTNLSQGLQWTARVTAAGLIVLGGHMILTTPLSGTEFMKNNIFGGTAFLLGLLLLAGTYVGSNPPSKQAPVALAIGSVFVGLTALVGAVASAQMKIFETAPPQEPVFDLLPKNVVGLLLINIILVLPGFSALMVGISVIVGDFLLKMIAKRLTYAAAILMALLCVLTWYTHIVMFARFSQGV